MHLLTCLTALVLAQPADRHPEGDWELTYYQGFREGGYDATHWIVNLVKTDGQLTGRVVATSSFETGTEIDEVRWDKGRLHIKFTPSKASKELKNPFGRHFEFEGVWAEAPEKGMLGLLQKGTEIYAAQLLPTKKKKIGDVGKGSGGRKPSEILQKSYDVLSKLRKPPVKGAPKLTKEQAEKAANEVVDEAIPLLEEALAKHPDTPAALQAAEFLLRQGVARGFALKSLEQWARDGEKSARPFGPRFHAEYAVRLAGILPATKDMAPLILELLKAAQKSLEEAHPLDLHCRVLWLKDAALRGAGDMMGSAALDEKWKKLEDRALSQYREKRPLPELVKFDGKAGDNDRVIVVEAIQSVTPFSAPTTAQAGMDALAATYPSDKVLVVNYGFDGPHQQHVRGRPNFDRYMGYQASIPANARVADPFFVNGVYVARLHHYDLSTQKVYDELRARIDPLVGKAADAKLSGKVVRRGDKLEIQANVTGLAKPADKALRVWLVEGSSLYARPAIVFMQKDVIRSVRSLALKEGVEEYTLDFDLAEVDRHLTPSCEGVSPREILNPTTHYDARNLVRARRWLDPRVVIMLIDQKSGEVLQATQVKAPAS